MTMNLDLLKAAAEQFVLRLLPDAHSHRFHRSGERRDNRVLHLHGLHDEKRIAPLHALV